MWIPASMLAAASLAVTPSPTSFAGRILGLHNQYRLLVGAPPLRWSGTLAASASRYGPALAAAGRLVHSPREGRPGQSENLWMGTRGVFRVEAMVEDWASERRMFSPGRFPGVSRTGDWQDVSHYTVMIWPTVTEVGCALHSAGGFDYLICRYSPRGNMDGRLVGVAGAR